MFWFADVGCFLQPHAPKYEFRHEFVRFNPRTCRGGGGCHPPPRFFVNNSRKYELIALKFYLPSGWWIWHIIWIFFQIGHVTYDLWPVSQGHVCRKWRSVVSIQNTRAVTECLRFRNICKGITTWHWWLPHSPWPQLTLSEVNWGQWPIMT